MTSSAEVAATDCTRPCPVCDQHLDLSKVETVNGPRARRVSDWSSAVPIVGSCKRNGAPFLRWFPALNMHRLPSAYL
jgi:hypothetical protein